MSLRPSSWLALAAPGTAWQDAPQRTRLVLLGTVIYRTLQPGEREVLRATREIVLRVGDAGALRWSRGSGAAEVMGPRGAVRTIRLTPGTPR